MITNLPSGSDKTLKFSERLAIELKWLPVVNKRYGDDRGPELNKKELFIMILIRNFNEACAEFVYVIKGPADTVRTLELQNRAHTDRTSQTKLLKMVFAGQIWDEPCFATPIHMRTWNSLINTPGLDMDHYEQVMITETKGMRYGFYFASAQKAYAQLQFSAGKYDALRKDIANNPVVESSSDTDSESVGLTDDELSDDEISDDDMSDDQEL